MSAAGRDGARGPRADAVAMDANTGGLVDGWFVEEDQGSTRLSIKVDEHLHSERSDFQKIDVYRSSFHGVFLTLDDLMMVTERDEFVYHEMLTHVPLCTMESPKSVLVIGGGDCGCVREVLRHPSIERVVQCEIDERVTRVSAMFFDWVDAVEADPRVELVFDDGVKYVEDHVGEFDLIIVDSTDPIGPAVGLFQADFYRKVARALRPGGVMCAQTESPFANAKVIGPIQAQIRAAFDVVELYWGSIPTYPAGTWSWTWASHDLRPGPVADVERAEAIAARAKYWNPRLHEACFAVPNFLRRAADGEDPFRRFGSGQ
mgnify:CR=1 FL=1